MYQADAASPCTGDAQTHLLTNPSFFFLTRCPSLAFEIFSKWNTKPPYSNTALGSDGQGPQGFSFVFLDLVDFFYLFADLARACLGSSMERPSRSCEFVRVRMDRTIAH
jgi:hypothetical protein